jgi:hypothetical protein
VVSNSFAGKFRREFRWNFAVVSVSEFADRGAIFHNPPLEVPASLKRRGYIMPARRRSVSVEIHIT